MPQPSDKNPNRKPSLLRRLLRAMLALERRYVQKIRANKSNIIGRVAHSDLFSIRAEPLCRGLAIGMFWACIPIPFQMFPALLFCLIGFANLPIAIICVWISNPLTYSPIFYVEYKIAAALFADSSLSFAEFRALWADDDGTPRLSTLGGQVLKLYYLVLQGGVILGMAVAVVCYPLGYPLSRYIKKHGKKFRRKK